MKKLGPKEYAFFLLKLRDRSKWEMEKKMKDKGFATEDIDSTVSFLEERGFIDDERFAVNYVRQKLLIRPHVKHWFEQKLYEKRISKDIIGKALVDLQSSREMIDIAVERWLSRHKGIEGNDLFMKLAPYLVRQGFDYDEVKEALSKLKNN